MISLQKFTKEHFQELISWIKSEEELMLFAGPKLTFPLTEIQLNEILENEAMTMFRVVSSETNTGIGHCQICLKEDTFLLCRVLVANETDRNKGYGKHIIQQMVDYGFSNFDRQIAELNVFDFNQQAIECYKQVGFTKNKDKSWKATVKDNIWTSVNMIISKEENEFRKKIVYEVYTEKNIEPLKKLALNSWKQFEKVLTPDNYQKLFKTLNSNHTYEDLLKMSTCFICKLDAEIIGMAFLVEQGNPTEIYQSDWCYIRFVSTHERFNGKGIAKKLTKMCIQFAKQRNEKVIALHTSEFMNAARHIYEKAGFKILKELEPRFGKKYWLYTLNL